MEKNKVEKINAQIEDEILSTDGINTQQEKAAYRHKRKMELLKEQEAEAELENKVLENEAISKASEQQVQAMNIDMERNQKDLQEYTDFWGTEWFRRNAKESLYEENYRLDPDRKLEEYRNDANKLIEEVEKMSEERRKDKNNAFETAMDTNRVLNKEELKRIEQYAANDKEAKIFKDYLDSNNGQIKLTDLLRMAPETMKSYLEAGNYHINATLNGIDKKANVLHDISDTMFHDGNTYQNTIQEANENKRRIIEIKEIEKATAGVRTSNINMETQAIRNEKTHERDSGIEERGE